MPLLIFGTVITQPRDNVLFCVCQLFPLWEVNVMRFARRYFITSIPFVIRNLSDRCLAESARVAFSFGCKMPEDLIKQDFGDIITS